MKKQLSSANEENYISNVNRKKLTSLAKMLFGRNLQEAATNSASALTLANNIIIESFPFSKSDILCPTSLEKFLTKYPRRDGATLKKDPSFS